MTTIKLSPSTVSYESINLGIDAHAQYFARPATIPRARVAETRQKGISQFDWYREDLNGANYGTA
jgi:hypothetical protein